MVEKWVSFARLGDEHIEAAKGNSVDPATDIVVTEVDKVRNGICDVCKVPCRGDKCLMRFSAAHAVVFMCEEECFKVYVFSSYTAGNIAYQS